MESLDQCPNCGTPYQAEAAFCVHCGQKKEPLKASASEMLGEFFSTLLAWDHRIWRTLKASLRPGGLTIAYFQGKRASLIPPARLFLFAVLTHLAVINFFLSPDLFRSDDRTGSAGQEILDLDRSIRMARESRSRLESASEPAPGSLAALDTLIRDWENRITELEDKRSLTLNFPLISDQTLSLSVLDMETSDPDSLCAKHGITTIRGRLIMHQLIKAYRHPRNFGNFIVARLSWMIFLLVPLMALVLYLLHIRGPWYYIEHLVFTMHVHVAAFLLVSAGLVLDAWLDASLTGWLLASSLAYTLLAMKQCYGQGWTKTLVKFLIYQTAYLWVGIGTGILLLIVGFFLFSA